MTPNSEHRQKLYNRRPSRSQKEKTNSVENPGHVRLPLCLRPANDAPSKARRMHLRPQPLEDKVRESQSKPSYRPSPVVAQALWMYHFCCRTDRKPSFSETSAH